MGKITEKTRIRRTRKHVPVIVAMASKLQPGGTRVLVKYAALDAWRALAMVPGWTPEMVDEVERVMAEVGR